MAADRTPGEGPTTGPDPAGAEEHLRGGAAADAGGLSEPGTGRPAGVPWLWHVCLLDGDRLSLFVPDGVTDVALRDASDGTVQVPPVELTYRAHDGATEATAVRWVLSGGVLPGRDRRIFELVARRADDEQRRRVWVDPLPEDQPTIPPPSSEGRWRLTLRRTRTGRLRVLREPVPRQAELIAVTTVPDGLRLTCTDPGGGQRVLLVREGTTDVAAAVDLHEEPGTGRLSCLLSQSDLPTEPGPFVLAVASADGRCPLVRWRNELRNPSTVLMPSLLSAESGSVVARLRFRADARVRLIRPGGRSAGGLETEDDGRHET